MGDLTNYTPSLSVNTQFGEENESFAIRGFQQDIGTSPTVGVYFADVVRPRGGFGGSTEHGGEGAGPGDFFDLQNVQVLKGPQGTLFGRNTTGGAILLVPQKPKRDFEGYVEVSGGNYGMEQVQAVVNVPLTDKLRVRVGLDQKTRDGYLINTSGIGPSNFNNTNYVAARVSVVADITDTIENYTIASFAQSNTNGPQQKLLACIPTSPAPSAALFSLFACPQVQGEGKNFYDVENDLYNAHSYLQDWEFINTTTWQATDDLTVKNIASYSHHDADFASSLFGQNWLIPSFFPGGGQHISFTNSSEPPGIPQSSEQAVTEELQVHGTSFDGKLDWQAGIYAEYNFPDGVSGTSSNTLLSCTNQQQLQCTDYLSAAFGGPVGDLSRRFGEISWRDYAAYTQGTYSITDWLKFEGGVRWTDDVVDDGVIRQLYYFGSTPGQAPVAVVCEPPNPNPSCLVSDHTSSRAPTWVLNLEATPIDGTNVYAQWARGYRQGGLMTTGPIGYEKYGPEHVDAYEVGIKANFKGPVPGFVDVAAFYNSFNDVQIQGSFINRLLTVPLNAGIQNAGTATIDGVEVETSLRPFTGVTLNASYAYLNSKLNSAKSEFFPTGPYEAFQPSSFVGEPLAYTPRNKFTIDLTYRLPVAPTLGKISVGSVYTYTGSEIVQAGGPYSYNPSFGLLNFNVNWEGVGGKPADIEFFITNALNYQYYQNTQDFSVATGFAMAEPGEPRMLGGRVRYHF